MKPGDIKWLQIGLTTRCNARCPLCMRTKFPPVIRDIDIEYLRNIPKMILISLVSSNGEPTLYPKFFEAIHIFKGISEKIKIYTNGSTHNETWWKSFANHLRPENGDHIVFPLDGLEDTYSLYRVGLSFKKTIKNIEAFTNAGGIVECHTLMFKHIEHQMVEIEKLAKEIGCKRFYKKPSWYYTKDIQMPDSFVEAEPGGCLHLSRHDMIMDVDGRIWPCCYMPLKIAGTISFEGQNENQEFMLQIKYKQSKDKMFTIKDAMQTPLYNYIMENMANLDICNSVCASCRTCSVLYKADYEPI